MTNLTTNELLFELENPQVYTGLEINVVKKDFKRSGMIDVCLVFPDKYEIGMSHYGHKLLYHLLNRQENVNAERCYLPGKKSLEIFKKYNFPLFSLENKIPLKDFDLIGFSLLSELNYTNVLQILDIAGIPLYAKERDDIFPLIAAGGISTINPEPLREFIDIFAIGDGEALFPDILRVIAGIKDKQNKLSKKEEKIPKKEILKLFAEIDGIYIPALHTLEKSGRFFRPNLEPGTIKKRVFKEIDDSFPDEEMIVPLTNVVFDRLTIEIARGCPQNCRFCQAKSYYAPFRSKSLGKIFHYINSALPATGFEGFSLTSLSSGDYPELMELLELIPRITKPGISFSVSSLRPATISGSLLSTISLFRRTGITIVPEAGSERLRRVINKDVTDEEIFKAVDLALKYNWQKMKLYFMIGLPGETLDDIKAIVQLIEDIIRRAKAGKKKINMHISFSPFVPKPHTPLQWVKQESLDEISNRIRFIKEELKKYKKIELDFHDPRSSVVETILARGDSRVGDLILRAFKKGEIFSAWDWDFNFSAWQELINEYGGEEFLKEIATGEPLPWDFIQVNYRKERLLGEYKNALEMKPMRRCAAPECKDCRGCIYGLPEEKASRDKINPDEYTKPQAAGRTLPGVEKKYNKIRIFYEKKGQFIFFSHLSMMKYLERLIRRSGVDFRCTEGFHPRIKMAALAPLPVYATALDEAAELYVDPFFSEELILDALNRGAGDFKFKKVVICNKAPKLNGDIAAIEYEIKIENPRRYKEKIEDFLVDTDSISYSEDKLFLRIDFTKEGQERFATIYRIIDPFKTLTRYLTRTRVEYRSERGNVNAAGS